jgi:hypothetical protein
MKLICTFITLLASTSLIICATAQDEDSTVRDLMPDAITAAFKWVFFILYSPLVKWCNMVLIAWRLILLRLFYLLAEYDPNRGIASKPSNFVLPQNTEQQIPNNASRASSCISSHSPRRRTWSMWPVMRLAL